MKAYIRAFINCEKNKWAKVLPIAKFAYNNAKYANNEYTPFELNCGYHPYISYKSDIKPYSKSKADDELTKKLRNFMVVCRKNLQYAQKLQKRAYDKGFKPRNYVFGEKVWLNSKYIKIKRN